MPVCVTDPPNPAGFALCRRWRGCSWRGQQQRSQATSARVLSPPPPFPPNSCPYLLTAVAALCIGVAVSTTSRRGSRLPWAGCWPPAAMSRPLIAMPSWAGCWGVAQSGAVSTFTLPFLVCPRQGQTLVACVLLVGAGVDVLGQLD
jgi:hypothetical protein